jgi:hypothetical protein
MGAHCTPATTTGGAAALASAAAVVQGQRGSSIRRIGLLAATTVVEDAIKSRYCRDNELKKCMPQFKHFSQQANVK